MVPGLSLLSTQGTQQFTGGQESYYLVGWTVTLDCMVGLLCKSSMQEGRESAYRMGNCVDPGLYGLPAYGSMLVM